MFVRQKEDVVYSYGRTITLLWGTSDGRLVIFVLFAFKHGLHVNGLFYCGILHVEQQYKYKLVGTRMDDSFRMAAAIL